jgi:dihydroorotate dehydrogenase
VEATGLTGIIVANTTISRPPLSSRFRDETGGLSGAPVKALSTRRLHDFAAASGGRLALIGAGGVASGEDAYAKIRAGACAVQLYSALVYEGPDLVTRVKRELVQLLRRDGFASVRDAVGRA